MFQIPCPKIAILGAETALGGVYEARVGICSLTSPRTEN